MRAVVFAYHEVGARCLQTLLDGGVDIQLVITHTDDPNERIWFTSVAEVAKAAGIPVITPESASTPEVPRFKISSQSLSGKACLKRRMVLNIS